MEQFYSAHQAPSQVDVCPLTDAAVLELLKERQYTMAELNNVLFRPLGDGDLQEPDVRVRAGRPEEAQAFAEILRESFFPDGDAPADFLPMLMPMFQFDGVLLFVAEVDGCAVACGAGLIIPKHKIVALFGAGTLPQFRAQGLQTALLKRRMAEAVRAGCEYAVIVTQGGTTSQRNAERLGFQVAYSKATMLKPFKSLTTEDTEAN
jgi:hypothetical protein